MTAAIGFSLSGALSSGLNFVNIGISKTYIAACNLTNAACNKLMEFGAAKKTMDFVSPYWKSLKSYYPDSLKFTWSKGTVVATTLITVVVAMFFSWIQSESSRVNEQMRDLKKTKVSDRSAAQNAQLKALEARKKEIAAAR